jgi:hypothetical protein
MKNDKIYKIWKKRKENIFLFDKLHNAEMMIKVLYVCLILQTLICIILSTK